MGRFGLHLLKKVDDVATFFRGHCLGPRAIRRSQGSVVQNCEAEKAVSFLCVASVTQSRIKRYKNAVNSSLAVA